MVSQLDSFLLSQHEVARLRRLILAMAMRGQLVPQDHDDEPASNLFVRMRRARDASIDAGEVKRADELPMVSPNEKPYKVPPGWSWVRLGDVGKIVGGGTPKSDVLKYWTGNGVQGVAWLTPADLYNWREKRIQRGRRDISHEGLMSSSAQMLPAGSVLFSSRAPIGYVAIAGSPLATNQGFKSCVPYISGLQDFLYWQLRHLAPSIDAEASGTTFREVSGRQIARLVIVLPPISEQARIVARIDELMHLCDALEANGRLEAEQHARLLDALLGTLTDSSPPEELAAHWQRLAAHFDLLLDRPEAVDAFERTILQLAVRGLLVPQTSNEESGEALLSNLANERNALTAPGRLGPNTPPTTTLNGKERFTLPPGWVWARLEQLSTMIVDCPHSTPRFVSHGVLCIDTASFKNGALIPQKLRYVDEFTYAQRVERLEPVAGDLVFAREGSVGESMLIPPETRACLGQRVMLFRFSKLVSNEFVRLSISTADFVEALLGSHKGIGAKHVNVGDMRRAVVPLPPFGEQVRIFDKVTELRRLCADLRQRLVAQQAVQSRLADALVEQALA